MMASMEGLTADMFDLVVSGDDAAKYGRIKPTADPYLYAVKELNAKKPLAFEDTQISLQSPLAAGIPCIAVPNEWSTGQDFSGASAQMAELGSDISLARVEQAVRNKQTEKAVDALLFGSVGTLVHLCERQYKAFNQALVEKGLPAWDKDTYVESLTSTGGQKRLAAWAQAQGLELSSEEVAALHARKSALFQDAMRQDGLEVRPGVVELLKEARAQGIKTAMVSTTAKANIDAMMASMEGLTADMFDLVVSGDDAAKYGRGKPTADPYLYAVKELNAKKPLAFEDTQISLQSPLAAGIPCIAVPNEWSTGQDFSGAAMKLSELGRDISLARVEQALSVKQPPKAVDALLFGSVGTQSSMWLGFP